MSYEKAQEELQNTLVKTYLSNLSFLYNYDNDLYLKVDELSNMINEGVYKEKYNLEFLEDQGEFDIYDKKNNKYLYNKRPKDWNDKVVRDFNLNEENSIKTLEEQLYSGKNYTPIKSKYELFNIDDGNIFTINNNSKIVNIVKPESKKKLKKITKTIFLGVLLGRHISRIINKHESDLYLVVERNLEIFRLSLFVLDLTLLIKKDGVIFSIMENEFDYEKKVIQFLQINPLDNYLLKLCTTDINIQSYLDSTLSGILSTKPSSFDYNRILYNFVRNTSEKISSNYQILNINQIKKNFKVLFNTPVLYIAAGPSLDDNIDLIRNNQKNFFIVTVGAAAKKLLDNDIKIDMIFSLDPQLAVMIVKQFPDDVVRKLKNTIIISSIITHKLLLDKFNQNNLFIYEVYKAFLDDNLVLDVSSVGELGLGMLIQMNVKEIYLVGLDFALNNKTGGTHSTGTSDIKEYSFEEKEIDSNKIVYGLRTKTFDVRGNFNHEVKTTGLFKSSIYHINTMLEKIDKSINIYNLSMQGAFFNNTIPTKINEINIKDKLDKDFLIKTTIEKLKVFSVDSLSDQKKQLIKKEIHYLKGILDIDIDLLKNYNFSSYDEFFLLIKEFLIKLTSFSKDIDTFTVLMNNHTQIIFNYLNYVFNDQKIKKEIKKVESIKTVYLNQVKELVEDYIFYLEKMVK